MNIRSIVDKLNILKRKTKHFSNDGKTFFSDLTISNNLTVSLILAAASGNATIVDRSITVPENYNFVLWGPISIEPDIDFIIDDDSNVTIKDISEV